MNKPLNRLWTILHRYKMLNSILKLFLRSMYVLKMTVEKYSMIKVFLSFLLVQDLTENTKLLMVKGCIFAKCNLAAKSF